MNAAAASWGRPRFRRPSLDTNLALLAGLVAAAGLPPYRWTGLLVPLGLALLFVVMRRSERPGRLAWFFSLAHQTVILHWLFLLIPAKSIPTRALVPVQAILTILYVSVGYLLLGWLYGQLRRRLGATTAFLLLPAMWTALEYLRSTGEMAFPWCLTGSCVIGTPLQSLAATAGELGLGTGVVFLAAAIAAFGGGAAQSGAGWPLARNTLAGVTALVWGALLAGVWIGGGVPATADGLPPAAIRAAAIQANVDLEDKWTDAKIDSTKIPYAGLTAAAAADGAEFIVWAETSLPAYLRYDKPLLNWTRQVVRESGAYLYAGFPDADRSPDGVLLRYNSSGLFAPDGELLDRYAKHHLLPIGEAMPFTRYLPFLAKIDVGQAEWAPGPPPRAQRLTVDGKVLDFSVMICFESALARLARESVRAGSRCLLVITNDGWFGRTAGPRQHADLALLRAAECRVPVIRCANNGISLLADDRGRVLDRLGLGRRGFVEAEIRSGPADSPFVRWGYRPLLIVLLVWAGLAVNLGRKVEEDGR